jgi:segregation and condensation protein B
VEETRRIIEALLFASEEPLSPAKISEVLEVKEEEAGKILKELKEEYEKERRGFQIREVARGYKIYTLGEFAPWIKKLRTSQERTRLTQAALETLAIVAYKQPLVRAEIESIRGVDVSGVLQTLLEKNLLEMKGRRKGPGRPLLYRVTRDFLKYFGLKDLSDLPSLEELKKLVEGKR